MAWDTIDYAMKICSFAAVVPPALLVVLAFAGGVAVGVALSRP